MLCSLPRTTWGLPKRSVSVRGRNYDACDGRTRVHNDGAIYISKVSYRRSALSRLKAEYFLSYDIGQHMHISWYHGSPANVYTPATVVSVDGSRGCHTHQRCALDLSVTHWFGSS